MALTRRVDLPLPACIPACSLLLTLSFSPFVCCFNRSFHAIRTLDHFSESHARCSRKHLISDRQAGQMASLEARGRPRISQRTAIIIGATIGGIYTIITLISIHLYLQRRLRRKIIAEQRDALHTACPRRATQNHDEYDRFATPQSRDRLYSSRVGAYTGKRSRHRSEPPFGSVRSAETLSTIRERPKTRRKGDYNYGDPHSWYPIRSGTFNTRRWSHSEDSRSRSQSQSNTEIHNPFWMFDGAYTESMRSTTRSRRRHSYSTMSTARVRRPSDLVTTTHDFVAEMNEKYPDVLSRSTGDMKGMAWIRQVSRSPSPSFTTRPVSRSPSQKVLQEIQEHDESYLPEVPLHPLIRKKSFERIVSGQFPPSRSVEAKINSKEKAREGEVIRIGSVKRVRELVDVTLNDVARRRHSRNASLNGLWMGLMGKRRSRISGETERSEREKDGEGMEIRASIETFSERLSEKA